jgi:HK97 gp10 family phage protein
MQKQALEYAVLQGANIIKNEASQRAPTGPRGGQRLRRSISAEKKKVLQKGVARAAVSWRLDAFWGLFIERGTKERFRKSWRYKPLKTGPVTTGVMPTRPFLEPAYDAKKGAAVAEIKKELWALVKKIAKRSKNIG